MMQGNPYAGVMTEMIRELHQTMQPDPQTASEAPVSSDKKSEALPLHRRAIAILRQRRASLEVQCEPEVC